tara:strand:+ start:6142 stop:6555 length:414 start_codon:yes stop_codon:yes gene_type:complete
MANPRVEAARAALEDQEVTRGVQQEAFSPTPSSVELDPGSEGEYTPAVDPGTMPRQPGAQGFDPGISGKTTDELAAARGRLVLQMANAEAGPQAQAYEKLLTRIDQELSMRQSAEIPPEEPETPAPVDIPAPAGVQQ